MYRKGVHGTTRAFLLLCGFMIVFAGMTGISARAFDSEIKAEFTTPDWDFSVVKNDDDIKKDYGYEYLREIGQPALKYGNTDMYLDENNTPEVSRGDFDTKYYFGSDFKFNESLLSLESISFKEISGNVYAVLDDRLSVTYVHAENGVVHRFQFWFCSEEEIDYVLSSAKYPSIQTITDAEDAYEKNENDNSYWYYFIIIAVVVVIAAFWFVIRFRTKKSESEEPDNTDFGGELFDTSAEEETSEDECDNLPEESENHCKAFDMESPDDAYRHITGDNRIVVKRYGDMCSGHMLHMWDDGGRALLWCKECEAYILLQKSEFHGIKDDDYYSYFFHISGKKTAEMWNENYSGEQLEENYPQKYLQVTNMSPAWANKEKGFSGNVSFNIQK